MGAGKTTVGRILARRLRWNFQDLDDVIEKSQTRSVADIFAESGEASFRAAESAALGNMLLNAEASQDGLVLALGGGAFAQPENRETLHRAGGMVVLLKAPVEELRRRCAKEAGKRPLASEPRRFEELYRARKAIYELAQFKVETLNKDVKQVAAEVEDLIAGAAGREVKR